MSYSDLEITMSYSDPENLPGYEASREAVRSSGVDPLQFLSSPSCRCEIICLVGMWPDRDFDWDLDRDLDRDFSLYNCEYFRGVKEWGKDGLFVELPSYTFPRSVESHQRDIARRTEYLRVVANISTCTALRFVDVKLCKEELLELWKALSSSKIHLKELSFLGRWQHNHYDGPYSSEFIADSNLDLNFVFEGLSSIMKELATVEKLSVALIPVDLIDIQDKWLIDITTLLTSRLISLQLSSWKQRPWMKTFNTIVENKSHVLLDLAFEEFLIDDSGFIDFMLCLKGNSRLERLSLNRCLGFSSSDSVIGAVLDALDANGLPELCIDGTPLEGNEAIREQLARNAFTRLEGTRLKNQRKVAASEIN